MAAAAAAVAAAMAMAAVFDIAAAFVFGEPGLRTRVAARDDIIALATPFVFVAAAVIFPVDDAWPVPTGLFVVTCLSCCCCCAQYCEWVVELRMTSPEAERFDCRTTLFLIFSFSSRIASFSIVVA